jgi:hypothetical protein
MNITIDPDILGEIPYLVEDRWDASTNGAEGENISLWKRLRFLDDAAVYVPNDDYYGVIVRKDRIEWPE